MRAFVLSGVLLSLGCLVWAAEPEPLVKVDEFHLKTERYGAAVVADGDYVYVIGGANRSGLLNDIERFDTRTHQVEVITNKLKPRRYHGAVFLDGKIFIVGGQAADVFESNVTDVESSAHAGSSMRSPATSRSREASEDLLSASLAQTSFEERVEIYDIATNQISYGAPQPTPRISAAVAGAGGKIFLMGGVRLVGRAAAQTNLTDVYDPASDRWSPGALMPTPREGNAVVVGDFIMIPGGFVHGSTVAKVEFYIPAQNSWLTLPDLTKPMGAGSVTFLGNYLFLFGSLGADSRVVAYDLRNRTSRVIKPGFKPSRHGAAIAHNGRIYVVGGSVNPEGDAYNDIQVFALAEAK